ncbi:MAG TPA: hypothetical protein VG714_02465 [Acidobacteriaceae bacterium]|nr:hypothetical protein [Acidobacteriaceae bacterium]
MNGLDEIDFDNLKPEDFERHLPDLFASGDGKVSDDPRLQRFLATHPDCAALVHDLETIAGVARSLLEPVEDPSDQVWANIQNKLREETGAIGLDDEEEEIAPPLPNGGRRSI